MSGDVASTEVQKVVKITGGKARQAARTEIKTNLEGKPRFCYLREENGIPLVTVCDITYNNKVYRGISIFSPRLNENGKLSTISPIMYDGEGIEIKKKRTVLKKKSGRKIALDRAIGAAMASIPMLPIKRKEAIKTLEHLVTVGNHPIDANEILSYKVLDMGAPKPR